MEISPTVTFFPCSAEGSSVEERAKESPSTGMAATKDASPRIAMIGILMIGNWCESKRNKGGNRFWRMEWPKNLGVELNVIYDDI